MVESRFVVDVFFKLRGVKLDVSDNCEEVKREE